MSLFHLVTSAANGRCPRDKWWVWEVTPNLGTKAQACHCSSWTAGAGELLWIEAQLGLLQKSDLWVINHHSESWGIQVQYAHECSEKICPDPWFLTPFTVWNFHLACYLVGLNFDLQNWGPWGGNFCSKHVHGSGAYKVKMATKPVSVCKNKGKGFLQIQEVCLQR